MKIIRIFILSMMTLMLTSCISLYDSKDTTETGSEESTQQIEAGPSSQEVAGAEVDALNADKDVDAGGPDQAVDEDQVTEENPEEVTAGNASIDTDALLVDINGVEDPSNYVSDLIFVEGEDDYWRVVDRQGNIFRVYTTNENAAVGSVNKGATLVLNEEDQYDVSLTGDFKHYSNPIVKTTEVGNVSSVMVDALFQRIKSNNQSDIAITKYEVSNMDQEIIGKGIVYITFEFRVQPSSKISSWGDLDSSGWSSWRSYGFLSFGYDKQWIVPTYPVLYEAVDIDDNPEDNLSEDEKVSDTGNSIQVSTSTNVLFQNSRNLLYQETEQLNGSNDTYTYLYIQNTTTEKKILLSKVESSIKFEYVDATDDKIYLLKSAGVSGSESHVTGFGYVDLSDSTFKVLSSQSISIVDIQDGIMYLVSDSELYTVTMSKGKLVQYGSFDENLSVDPVYDIITLIDVKEGSILLEIENADGVVQVEIQK